MDKPKQWSVLKRPERPAPQIPAENNGSTVLNLRNNKFGSGRIIRPQVAPTPLPIAGNSSNHQQPAIVYIEQGTERQSAIVYVEQGTDRHPEAVYIVENAEGGSDTIPIEPRAESQIEPKRQLLYAEAVSKVISSAEDDQEAVNNADVETISQNDEQTSQSNAVVQYYEPGPQSFREMPNASNSQYRNVVTYNHQDMQLSRYGYQQQLQVNKSLVSRRPPRPNAPQQFLQQSPNYNAQYQQQFSQQLNMQLYWYNQLCFGSNNVSCNAAQCPLINRQQSIEMQQQPLYYQYYEPHINSNARQYHQMNQQQLFQQPDAQPQYYYQQHYGPNNTNP